MYLMSSSQGAAKHMSVCWTSSCKNTSQHRPWRTASRKQWNLWLQRCNRTFVIQDVVKAPAREWNRIEAEVTSKLKAFSVCSDDAAPMLLGLFDCFALNDFVLIFIYLISHSEQLNSMFSSRHCFQSIEDYLKYFRGLVPTPLASIREVWLLFSCEKKPSTSFMFRKLIVFFKAGYASSCPAIHVCSLCFVELPRTSRKKIAPGLAAPRYQQRQSPHLRSPGNSSLV